MVNKSQFLNAIEQNITMVRGDNLTFNFSLQGLGNQAAYEALTVEFNAAYNITEAPCLSCDTEDGIELYSYDSSADKAIFTVCVIPEKTKELDLTRYYYNLQIKDTDNVITLMRGRLTLVYEID